jgi:BirA family biotin operon repressor/biotin-[acetyl-CoA-carboxylase] ligase
MKIIKLNAIDSTNDFLKKLIQNTEVIKNVVIRAEYQTNGRGQMLKSWQSERGKNLLFSALYAFDDLKVINHFYLNKVVSIAVSTVLKRYIPNVKIKWPNDIMSFNHKVSGVLIENVFNGDLVQKSIIGVGVNVNQVNFDNLPKATSLKCILKRDLDIDFILMEILEVLDSQIMLLKEEKFSKIDTIYFKNLYRFQKPSMYYNEKFGFFMAKIVDVKKSGLLQMELEDESICTFNLKEIQFL